MNHHSKSVSPDDANEPHADPIGEIAGEFLDAMQRGESPNIDQFAERYPDHADEIRDLMPTLLVMEQARNLEASDGSAGRLAMRDPGMIGRVLGDYRIIRVIGRGGMGVVYEAEQVSLGRRVALKVLPQQYLADSKQRFRFEREARAAAKLHHTNIVPVFGVGAHDGVSYFVMQYIHGLGLDEVLDELRRLRAGQAGTSPEDWPDPSDELQPSASVLARSIQLGHIAELHGGLDGSAVDQDASASGDSRSADSNVPKRDGESESSKAEAAQRAHESEAARGLVADMLSQSGSSVSGLMGSDSSSHGSSTRNSYWLSVARIGVQVADALHYAHQQGITHRDIKPGNLLLDLSNTVWVTDFGLAKAEDQNNLTHTGDLLGTLRYMPPEAFKGSSDKRGDVYSLGITLHELITLRPAFNESDRHILIHRIADGDIGRLPAEVPRDLATIVQKAVEHDAGDRYQSAKLLQDDLQRFLHDEPIQARSPSKTERLIRWSRRNRALAASLAGILTLLLVIASIMTAAAAYYRHQQVVQSQLFAKSDKLGKRNLRLLADTREAEASAVAAGDALRRTLYFEQMWVAHQSMSQHRGLAKASDLLNEWTPSPGENDLRGWEWYYIRSLCNREEYSLAGHTAKIVGLDWRSDGNMIASASADGTVRLWDLRTRELYRSFEEGLKSAICTAWSKDGSLIAVGGEGGFSVWDLETGEKKLSAVHDREVFGFAWSPDGTKLAAAIKETADGSPPGEIQVFRTDEWVLAARMAKVRIGYYNATIGWDPTGQLLANPGGNNVAVWNLNSEKRVRWFRGHTREVQGVSFNPNGQRFLASASRDSTIKIWDLTAERLADVDDLHTECIGHTHGVASIAWHPDGEILASGSWDGTARLWNGLIGRELAKFNCHRHHCFAVAWNPDGTQLATAGDDNLIKFWDARLHGDTASITATPNSLVDRLSIEPGGERVLCRSNDSRLSIWNSKSLEREEQIHLSGQHFRDACFSSNRKNIITLHLKRGIEAIELDSGNVVVHYETAPVKLASITVLGQRLIAGHAKDGLVYLWNLETGALINAVGEGIKDITTVSLSPDGRTLGVGTRGAVVYMIDLETSETRTLELGDWIECIDWSPNGERYAISSHHETRIWDATLHEQVATLTGHHETVRRVDWSPDGRRLLTADARGQIIVWDSALAKQSLVLKTPIGRLSSAFWSDDGLRIIASSNDKIVVWDAEKGYRVAGSTPPR